MICLFGYYRCVTLRHALCTASHHVTFAIIVTLSFLRDFILVTLYLSRSISRDFSSPYCSSTHKSYLVTLRCCLCHVTFLMSRSLSCICILVTLSFLRDFTLVTLYMSRSLSLISRHCAGPLHTRFYLCHGPYNVTVVHHCVLVSTRCHLPHVT